MFDYDELLSTLPIDQLAQRVGASPEDVEAATRNALPALLMGMGANTQDPAGEASLASAVGQHDPRLVQGGINLDDVDQQDGAKIAHHIFGDNEDQVVNQLGGLGGGNALIQKLLPILAPIVMSWLAGKLMGADEAQGQPRQAPSSGGGGLGDILGQILGGGASAPQAQPQQPSEQPQFRVPTGQADDGTLRMPEPEAQQRQSQPQQQTMPGGLGGGILGDILGGLLGGGRR
ncbi:DUF937 domain-containing protein [Tessaracoccus sp. G1721]